MDEDERCCGTGTCLINAQGLCWCGQQWNGTTLCPPALPQVNAPVPATLGSETAQGNTP